MAFNTALTGLSTSSAELNLIGNNIANASTTGFKKSKAEFADIYAAANLGTSSNAIGTGVKLASVSQQFSQGNIENTDNNMDLAISGQGFFRLDDNGSIVFSRSGAFSVNRDGYIVNSRSQKLTAYAADSIGNITGAIVPLQINTADIAPKATTRVDVGVNLNSAVTAPTSTFDVNDSTTYNNSTSLTMYDSLGASHLATTYFIKTASNTWDTHLFIDGAEATPSVTSTSTLTFNGDGSLATPAGGTVSYAPFTVTGAQPLTLTMDYGATTPSTQFGSEFGVNALTQDGSSSGRLSSIDIADTGIVQARFTNGQSRAIGQVVLANFSNPQGLRQMGDTTWAETFDSGSALVGAPSSASLGTLQSGALEASNVELTQQLVAMITAQRDFQANAQVITTSDQITQTIINIK